MISVIPHFLDACDLAVLKKECDFHRNVQLSSSCCDPSELGAAVDLFEHISLPENHSARSQTHSYFQTRFSVGSNLEEHERSRIQNILLEKLPNELRRVVLEHQDNNEEIQESVNNLENIFLFNESYIVKEGDGNIAFRWHTDEDEQLMALPQDFRRKFQYWSMWCPLDDVNEQNGTLFFPNDVNIQFLSEKKILETSKRKARDNCSTTQEETKDSEHCNKKLCKPAQFSKNTFIQQDQSIIEESKDSPSPLINSQIVPTTFLNTIPDVDDKGQSVEIPAGSLVIFSSYVWHRSSVNETSQPRRVFYVQYSSSIISHNPINPHTANCPLSFAIKCFDH